MTHSRKILMQFSLLHFTSLLLWALFMKVTIAIISTRRSITLKILKTLRAEPIPIPLKVYTFLEISEITCKIPNDYITAGLWHLVKLFLPSTNRSPKYLMGYSALYMLHRKWKNDDGFSLFLKEAAKLSAGIYDMIGNLKKMTLIQITRLIPILKNRKAMKLQNQTGGGELRT